MSERNDFYSKITDGLKNFGALIVFLITVVFCLNFFPIGCSLPSKEGRFQISSSEQVQFVLDTKTGSVWSRDARLDSCFHRVLFEDFNQRQQIWLTPPDLPVKKKSYFDRIFGDASPKENDPLGILTDQEKNVSENGKIYTSKSGKKWVVIDSIKSE